MNRTPAISLVSQKSITTEHEGAGFDRDALIRAIPDIVFRIGGDGTYLACHVPDSAQILVPPDNLLGRKLTDVVPDELGDRAMGLIKAAIQTGETQTFIYDLEIDGETYYFESRMARCGDDEVVTVSRNITDRKRAEEYLRESEKRYRGLVENQSDLICRWLPDSTLTFVNNAYCSYFGRPRDQVIGKKWLDFLEGKQRKTQEEHIASLLADPRTELVEYEVALPNGKLAWLQWMDHAVSDENGDISEFQSIGRDTTERRNLEMELIEISNREQQRIGLDLHDGLGQELTGIKLLLKGLESPVRDCCPQHYNELNEVTNLLARAIANTRALARGLSPVDLDHGGLPDALAFLALDASKIYDVKCDFSADAVTDIHFDSQVANNLYRIAQEAITNAVRHGKAKQIKITLSQVNGEIALTISDNGKGIPMPLRTRKTAGMGLRIMDYRARMINATLDIKRPEGGGTRVICQFSDPGRRARRPASGPVDDS